MRLKLVFAASIIAAIVGAGSTIAIIALAFSSLKPVTTPGPLVLSSYLLPVVTTFLAAFFVYRHTARRRKLQAILTALISTTLTLLLFLAGSIISHRFEPQELPPAKPQNVG
jgi:hypothetical protein